MQRKNGRLLASSEVGEVTMIPERPTPPPCRLIKEGGVDFCKTCGSTQKRAWFGLGRVLGCIQPKCWNYYRWRSLPVGVNPPAGLYGGPVKPPAPPAPPDAFYGPFGTVRSGYCSKCQATSHVLSQRDGLCIACVQDGIRRIVREELERTG
jgi:hypothetical protein